MKNSHSSTQNPLKFPYGLSDFRRIIIENQVYIDRTEFISSIEQAGEQLLFLRPRRFGKSLWLSTLENYYDLAKAEHFQKLFGHLTIGQTPTPLHNHFFILKWNFSVIDASGDHQQINRSIHNHINGAIDYFSACYRDFLGAPVVICEEDSLRSFKALLSAIKPLNHPLYLLIDEYDNFANEVISSRQKGRQRYDELVHGEGIIKTLFKAIKAAAEGEGLERVFITGVSPIVMSDITSGYNVVENITHYPEFNSLCGFSSAEVSAMVTEVALGCGLKNHIAEETMRTLKDFYNGYSFSSNTTETIYNPTLSFYFLKAWQRECRYPAKMLDTNLAMDRNRIDYIASLPHGESVIEQLLDDSQTLTINTLADEFGVEAILDNPPDATFLISLLTYFGVLTVDNINEYNELSLTIPNQVIRSLYVERIQKMLSSGYSENELRQSVAKILYTTGKLEPLCDFIEQHFFQAIDNRDLRWSNELTLKMTLLILLTNDFYYIPRSEPAIGKGYGDFLLEIRPDKRQTPLFDHLFELKYIPLNKVKASATELDSMTREEIAAIPIVNKALDEAETQLKTYQKQLQKDHNATDWKLYSHAIVTIGLGRLVWRTKK